MHKYLLDEMPIQLYPSLAEKVGLYEAILLQKLHGWLFYYSQNPAENEQTHYRSGRWWVYGSPKYWREQIHGIFSAAAIRRAFDTLREKGIIITGCYNKARYDRTLWYSIDYEKYDLLWQNNTICSVGADGCAPEKQMDVLPESSPIPICSSIGSSKKEENANSKQVRTLYAAEAEWLK